MKDKYFVILLVYALIATWGVIYALLELEDLRLLCLSL